MKKKSLGPKWESCKNVGIKMVLSLKKMNKSYLNKIGFRIESNVGEKEK